MLFNIPYFNLLPNGYCEAVIKLDNELKSALKKSTKYEILLKFVKNYTTITPIWEYWKNSLHYYKYDILNKRQFCHFYSFSLLSDSAYESRSLLFKQNLFQRRLNKKVVNDSYIKILKATNKKNYRNITEYNEFIQYSEEAIKYPSECLKKIYLNYCINYGSFIPKKIKCQYQQSLKLLNELERAEKDDEKWIECLLKVEDEDYIITNFEFRLEVFSWNQNLWQFYIDYLKKINSTTILDVYSRYCRFFIDDSVAQEKYRSEIERLEQEKINVTKWWIDIILLEKNSEKAFKMVQHVLLSKTPKSKDFIRFAKKIVNKVAPEKTEETKRLIQLALINITEEDEYRSSKDILSNPTFDNDVLKFDSDGNIYLGADFPALHESTVSPLITVGNFNTYKSQQFSLPKTICNYIFQNPNYFLRQKLFSTCKYFVVLYQTPVCCNIAIKTSPDPVFYGQSIAIPESSFLAVKDYYVVNTLDAWRTQNPLTVSNLCSTVFEFDLKFLKLHTQNLTKKEFEFLTASGNIESVYLVTVSIFDPDGQKATLEEIIERFPKASRLRLLYSTQYSPETAQNLLKLKRSAKIEQLQFNSSGELDVESFSQFIQKNAAPKAKIFVMFENVEEDYLQFFKDYVNEMLKTWEPQNDQPKLDVR